MKSLGVVLLVALSCAAQSQSTAYTAPIDTVVHTYSPLTLPAANVVFSDPDFVHTTSGGFCKGVKTCMVRATDPGTAAALGGGQASNVSFHTSSGSPANQWSIDDTHFVVSTSQGNRAVLMNFASATGKVTLNSLLPATLGNGTGQPDFSYTQATKLYGYNASSPQIMEYDINSRSLTQIYDLTKCPGLNAAGTGGGVDTSFDIANYGYDNRYATTINGDQNSWTTAAVIDRHTGTCRWYNTVTDQIGGDTNFPGGPFSCSKGVCASNVTGDKTTGYHAIELSHDGNYVLLMNNGATPKVWQISTNTLKDCNACQVDGHRAWGYNEIVDAPSSKNGDWHTHPASAPAATNMIAPYLPCIGAPCNGIDHHVTWANSNASESTPVFQSSYANNKAVGGTVNNTTPGVGEITATAYDGSNITWRFCHSRTNAALDNDLFYHTPRGNVSKDGKVFIFTTNWNGTLGKDNGGHYRDDVVICELR
jgi:hypothetical protein